MIQNPRLFFAVVVVMGILVSGLPFHWIAGVWRWRKRRTFDQWQATESDRLNVQAQRLHDEEMREFGEWVMEEEDDDGQ